MFRKKTPLFIGFMVVLSVGSLGVFGQKKESEIKDRRVTIQMTQKPLYTIFVRLLNKYDIAIGFEESILDRGHQHYVFETNIATDEWKAKYSRDKEILPAVIPFSQHLITLDFKDARLEEVLDSIVKQMENYGWEINNDVVNIFPIRGRDLRLKKLLDSKVNDFVVGAGEKVESIQTELMLFLPEFNAFLEENNLEGDCERSATDTIGLDRILPDGMRFSGLTFKELLNAITKSKRGGWILQIKTHKEFPGREFVEILI